MKQFFITIMLLFCFSSVVQAETVVSMDTDVVGSVSVTEESKMVNNTGSVAKAHERMYNVTGENTQVIGGGSSNRIAYFSPTYTFAEAPGGDFSPTFITLQF